MEAYQDSNHQEVAPIDAHAANACAKQTQLDQERERRAKILRSAQEAHSNQIQGQIIRNKPDWLSAKLLEQPENATIKDLCFSARNHLSIQNH